MGRNDQIEEFFAPLIGQPVWQVRRGYGSFLTMEFGIPHLVVREPIEVRRETTDKVRQLLSRRHVSICGDWHFWIQYCDWKIITTEGNLSSDDAAGSRLDECLRNLEGQKLVSVGMDVCEPSCTFAFDLGASLKTWPSSEIPDDQWGVYGWDGDIVTLSHDGLLTFEKAEPDKQLFRPLHPTL